VHLTKEPIFTDQFLSAQPDPSCGAAASFVGIVRNHHLGRSVVKLFYECYEPLAEKQVGLIVDRAMKQWPVREIRVLHRIGWLQVGDVAVAIAVHTSHREEAFSACRYVIEEIKKSVPIWKREVFGDGTEQWVTCT
jgi:molybdopterin synthase catalytic subunit